MTTIVYCFVLLAAVLHAGWNFWLKISGDRLISLSALATGWALVGVVSIVLLGPPARAAWPFLFWSTVVHTAYSLTLIRVYRHVDLSVAYPVARGIGPIFVALVSVLLLDDLLHPAGLAGVVLTVAGAIWLGFPKSRPDWSNLMLSVLTGTLIGIYTLLDGIGGRVDSPHIFSAWLFVLTPIPVLSIAFSVHRERLIRTLRPVWWKGVLAGVLSAAAYWIAIWAMSQAPMGLVAALRESSVLFAALLGAVFLRERVKWSGVVLVLVGIVLTKLA